MSICNKYFLLLISCICIISCKNAPSKNHGPIKLGDPSTIVTEADPQKLQDLVTDLAPVIPPSAQADTSKPAAPVADTSKKTAATPAPAPLPTGPGMKAEFKEVTVLLPGVDAKQSGKPNLLNANGAVYTWVSGKIDGNVIHTMGNVTKVSQRYQAIVILKGKNGSLPLDELSNTTSWAQVSGSNGAYPVKGLGEGQLSMDEATNSEIRNAVSKSARQRKLSHKKTEEWLDLIGKNVRSVSQKPLVITLRSAMWKIDGKDEKGKIFSKQIRIDIPM